MVNDLHGRLAGRIDAAGRLGGLKELQHLKYAGHCVRLDSRMAGPSGAGYAVSFDDQLQAGAGYGVRTHLKQTERACEN